MTTVICTDGACPNNQDSTIARGGVGVYFGPDDVRNISEPLTGILQTNNRAELTAFLYAIEYALKYPGEKVHIVSDSTYCVKGYKEWLNGWVRRNWVRSSGGPVKNMDLWKRVYLIKQALTRARSDLTIEWMRGHDKHPGNEAADKLAVAGAAMHAT